LTYRFYLKSAVGAAKLQNLTGGVGREFKEIKSCGKRNAAGYLINHNPFLQNVLQKADY
jgi:hypothetical protein